jgi:hypothetical protein
VNGISGGLFKKPRRFELNGCKCFKIYGGDGLYQTAATLMSQFPNIFVVYFWYIEKMMYLICNMNQIHHFFDVSETLNLLIIITRGSIYFCFFSSNVLCKFTQSYLIFMNVLKKDEMKGKGKI